MSDERTEDRVFRAWGDFDRICDHDNMTKHQYFLEGWRGGENAARAASLDLSEMLLAAIGTAISLLDRGRVVEAKVALCDAERAPAIAEHEAA